MNNFFNDNEDILFHLKHTGLEKVVDLKEDNFVDFDKFMDAPKNYEDTLDNYKRVLETIGDICANDIAPNASDVDAEGASFKDGKVTYAKGTSMALKRLKQADLMGFTIPRKYNGINMPKTVYSMAIELISRADASLMNLFGLQEIADTIHKFGDDDQRERYLPRFCSGEVMGSMALTEPDAGSDLQAVMLTAEEQEDKSWTLNGVKRFITNGCAKISLVMARSEKDSKDGRGLSLFIYERDEKMIIRRIEHKLGIHGSPTCELQFNNAPAEILGRRRFGLIKYTMSLMNGARLGVSAQAIGIAEAAYRESIKYAKQREQFKKPIIKFAAVKEMLSTMKVKIEAGRSLLYETSKIVDIKEGNEERLENGNRDAKDDVKKYTKYAALMTPLLKCYTTEMSNQVTYDAIQIHGGVGFTCEFDVERLYRDARITNIYEGTTQLQVVAAINGVMNKTILEILDDLENENNFKQLPELFEQARSFRAKLESTIDTVKDKGDAKFQEFHSRRLVEMTADTVMTYLLVKDALQSERKQQVAQVFIEQANHRLNSSIDYIISQNQSVIDFEII